MPMRQEGKAELACLQQMVLAWKEDYLRWASATAHLDFLSEIEEVVYPYLRRLRECDFIDEKEAGEFMRFCDEQAQELCKLIGEVD